MILAAGRGFEVPEINHLFTFRPFFSFQVAGITFNVTFLTIVMFALTFILTALFIAAFRRPAVVPGKLQNVMEAAVDAVRENIVIQTIGPDGERFLPHPTAVV